MNTSKLTHPIRILLLILACCMSFSTVQATAPTSNVNVVNTPMVTMPTNLGTPTANLFTIWWDGTQYLVPSSFGGILVLAPISRISWTFPSDKTFLVTDVSYQILGEPLAPFHPSTSATGSAVKNMCG